MKRPDPYTISERQAIADGLLSGGPATCPRCGGPLDEWPVPPRADVSYVRDRLWLVCRPCSRTVILDRHDPKG